MWYDKITSKSIGCRYKINQKIKELIKHHKTEKKKKK